MIETSDMYQLAFSDKEFFFEVRAVGELTADSDLGIDKEISQEGETRNIDSVLIDIRQMKTRLTGVENHVAAESFNQRMNFFSSIAILDLEKYQSNSDMFELTARNRDANVRFFVEKHKAVEWLLEQKIPPQ